MRFCVYIPAHVVRQWFARGCALANRKLNDRLGFISDRHRPVSDHRTGLDAHAAIESYYKLGGVQPGYPDNWKAC